MKLLNTFIFLLLSCFNAYCQGIINSSGYITNNGAPHIIFNNASLDNSGTWTKATEVVSFTGNLTSQLKGSTSSFANLVMANTFTTGTTLNTTSVITCDNLTINSLGIFTIAPTSKITVGTTLTNSGGNAGLVIKSTVNGSGSVISTSLVSATVEQYHTDSNYVYHMVSSPITAATAAAFLIAGVQTYVYTYNPATPAWVNVTTSSTALNVGEGYLVNYHNMSVDRTATYIGTLNTGNISPSLSATTAKFNFVGNPYPCAMDWDGSGWTKTNISGTYYLWLPAKGSYGTYTTSLAVSVNGINNIIHSGQGFFVYATGSSPMLTMGNASKTHNNSILKSAKVQPPLLKIHISNDANAFSDEAVILFLSEATKGYDVDLDAMKMFTLSSESSQIYTSSDKKDVVINSLPIDFKDSIPLYFKCNKEATYTLELSENTWGDTIFITDLITNKTAVLTGNKYAFTALKTDTTLRFVLNAKTVIATNLNNIEVSDVSIYSNGRSVFLKNRTGKELKGELEIIGITGQKLVHQNINLITEIIRDFVTPGIYIVSFKVGNHIYRGKIVINNL